VSASIRRALKIKSPLCFHSAHSLVLSPLSFSFSFRFSSPFSFAPLHPPLISHFCPVHFDVSDAARSKNICHAALSIEYACILNATHPVLRNRAHYAIAKWRNVKTRKKWQLLAHRHHRLCCATCWQLLMSVLLIKDEHRHHQLPAACSFIRVAFWLCHKLAFSREQETSLALFFSEHPASRDLSANGTQESFPGWPCFLISLLPFLLQGFIYQVSNRSDPFIHNREIKKGLIIKNDVIRFIGNRDEGWKGFESSTFGQTTSLSFVILTRGREIFFIPRDGGVYVTVICRSLFRVA